MRILLLNTYPIWGGDEKWTINVCKGLSQRGHYVLLACYPGSETEKRATAQEINVHPFKIGPDIAFWKIWPLQKLMKKHRIEAVFCVQNRDVKIGGLAAKLIGIPAIFSRQGLTTIKRNLYYKTAYIKLIDGIITNTKSIKAYYNDSDWIPKEFIHVVYDGLELPDNIPILDLHKEFELLPNSKVIICTGRLAEQKRFDLMIKVASIAKLNNKNWSIIVAGTGRLENDLKNLSKESGVDDIIKFIGFRNDVLTLMSSADIFVLSSDSEGMSNALKEAMGLGKPCVSTNVYGVSELFEDDTCGIMVERGNAQGIYDAVDTIFSDAELRQKLQKNAALLIKTKFTIEKMLDEIEQLFLSQLAMKK